MTSPESPEPIYTLGQRPALDGLRALAILLVFLSHAVPGRFGGGFVGVDLFFVLSGFLITSLLLEERRDVGAISLKAFYARRGLRLLPALVLMLGSVVLLSAVLEPSWKAQQFRVAALMTLSYVANWFYVTRTYPASALSHTWSLSIEEQFYVVWPILLALLLRAKATRTALQGFVVCSILGVAALRVFLWFTSGAWVRVYFGSDTHADGLLLGALLAMMLSWGAIPVTPTVLRGLNAGSIVVLTATPFCIAFVKPVQEWLYLGGYLAVNVAAAVLVATAATGPASWFRMLFETSPVRWVGRVSYGIYLWHSPSFWLTARMFPERESHQVLAAIPITLACAAVSFYALERPLLKLKRRFERVHHA